MSKRNAYDYDTFEPPKKIRAVGETATIPMELDALTEWYSAEQVRKIIIHLKRQHELVLAEREAEYRAELRQQFQDLTSHTKRETPSYIS
jgi:hypothetical protein